MQLTLLLAKTFSENFGHEKKLVRKLVFAIFHSEKNGGFLFYFYFYNFIFFSFSTNRPAYIFCQSESKKFLYSHKSINPCCSCFEEVLQKNVCFRGASVTTFLKDKD
jgi:hypothetical protein